MAKLVDVSAKAARAVRDGYAASSEYNIIFYLGSFTCTCDMRLFYIIYHLFLTILYYIIHHTIHI